MHELYELKEKLMDELKEYGSKDEMTAGTLEVVDKLAHTIKNLCKIIEDAEGYSERGSYGSYADGGSMRRGSYADGGSMRGGSYRGSYDGGSYDGSYDGGSMRGGSYARGRGRNARRDSRGRYSSGNDMMMEELQGLMEEAPDGRTREEIQKLIQRMGQM